MARRNLPSIFVKLLQSPFLSESLSHCTEKLESRYVVRLGETLCQASTSAITRPAITGVSARFVTSKRYLGSEPEDKSQRPADFERVKNGDSSDGALDMIHLVGLQFVGHHGVMSEEKILGQRFVVDCTLHVDLRAAGASDSLNDTVDYANVYRVIGSVVTGKPKNLIEAVAEEICARIFRMDSRVESVDCTVKKPHVAVGGIVEYLGVSIRRERGERQSSDACSGEDEEGEAKESTGLDVMAP